MIDTKPWIYVVSYGACFAFGFVTAFLIGSALGALPAFCIALSVVTGALIAFGMKVYLSDSLLDTKKANLNGYVLLGALLAFLGIVLIYLNLGVYPFGDRSVLIIDMHHQYVAFFSLMRDKFYSLFSGDSMFYSTKVGLGSGFISLFAYYLSSPVNILVLIFPRSLLTEAIALIEVIKIAAAGLTFSVLYRFMFKRNDATVPILSTAYALMSYLIVYSWDVMWLDSIVLLPMCVYGVYLLLEEKRPALYIASLAGALITNYYIAYMICIFLVFYFFAHCIIHSKGWSFKDFLGRGLKFAGASIIGGGLGAFLVIPTYLSLGSTYGADDVFARNLKTYFNLFDIFGRAMFSASPSLRGDKLPNVYCSVFAVLLICVFFLCKAISLRKKVAYGGLLTVLVACASINWTYFAFHGFHWPSDLPHRFSFLISFVMLLMAADVLAHLESVTSRDVGKALFICIGLLVMTELIGNEEGTMLLIYISLLFFLIYGVILLLATRKKIRSAFASYLLIATVFIEMTAGGCVTNITMCNTEVFTKRDSFTSDYEVVSQAVDVVDGYNKPQYRTELLPRKTCNDASLFGYSGLTVFASSNTESVIKLMGNLGYAVNGVNSHMYHSYVPLVDSILNLRYLIFKRDNQLNHAQLTFLDSVTVDEDRCYIYKNPYALSRGFVVDNAISYIDTYEEEAVDELEEELEEEAAEFDERTSDWDYLGNNPFEVQNSFVAAALGGSVSDTDVYTMLYPETSNVEKNSCSVTFNDTYFHASPSGSKDFSFTAVVSASDTAQHYVYVDCRAADSISVSCGTNQFSSTPHEPYIIDLGTVSKGKEINVTINSEIDCVGNVFIASMDDEKFEKVINALSESQLEVERYSESKLSGTVDAKKSGVMFTSIPYDKGWKVKIDGEIVETYPIGDALLGFDIAQGEHEVEMSYSTYGLGIGILISVVCLLAFLLLVMLCYDKPRKWLSEHAKFMQPILDKTASPASPIEPVEEYIENRPEGFSINDIDIFDSEE